MPSFLKSAARVSASPPVRYARFGYLLAHVSRAPALDGGSYGQAAACPFLRQTRDVQVAAIRKQGIALHEIRDFGVVVRILLRQFAGVFAAQQLRPRIEGSLAGVGHEYVRRGQVNPSAAPGAHAQVVLFAVARFPGVLVEIACVAQAIAADVEAEADSCRDARRRPGVDAPA
jgi:hypothetical protein